MEDKELKNEEIEKLVRLSQNGSSDAFAKIYDLFVDQIYRYVYYRVGQAEAEDLTELVFLKTWENIKQYRKSFKRFSSWIFRIAHNLVIDHYRANHTVEEISEQVEDERKEADTKHLVSRTLNNEILSRAMKELKDEYKQILTLAYINDFSNEEISVIMNRSRAALRILKFRALRNLRRLLETMGVTKEFY